MLTLCSCALLTDAKVSRTPLAAAKWRGRTLLFAGVGCEERFLVTIATFPTVGADTVAGCLGGTHGLIVDPIVDRQPVSGRFVRLAIPVNTTRSPAEHSCGDCVH